MRSFAISLYALALLNVAFSAPTPAEGENNDLCRRSDGTWGPRANGGCHREGLYNEHKFGDEHGDERASQFGPREDFARRGKHHGGHKHRGGRKHHGKRHEAGYEGEEHDDDHYEPERFAGDKHMDRYETRQSDEKPPRQLAPRSPYHDAEGYYDGDEHDDQYDDDDEESHPYENHHYYPQPTAPAAATGTPGGIMDGDLDGIDPAMSSMVSMIASLVGTSSTTSSSTTQTGYYTDYYGQSQCTPTPAANDPAASITSAIMSSLSSIDGASSASASSSSSSNAPVASGN